MRNKLILPPFIHYINRISKQSKTIILLPNFSPVDLLASQQAHFIPNIYICLLYIRHVKFGDGMKKTVLIALCLLLFSVFACLIFVENVSADGNTIYVDDNGGKDYTSIQDAIDAASPGDTVYVYSGKYYENIVINKTINLFGNSVNTDDIIIDGNKNGNVIEINADFVNISGFTIQNSGDKLFYTSGIFINSKNNIFISHNNIIDNEYGIYIISSDNNLINDNTFSNNSRGVYMRGSIKNNITKNVFYNNTDGLFLEGSSYNLIKNNTFNQNEDAFVIWNFNYPIDNPITSNNNTVYYNNFYEYDDAIVCSSENNIFYNKKTLMGNYWMDYFYLSLNYGLLDKDFDGVGEIPYDIECGGEVITQDLYPLMEPTEVLTSGESKENDVDTYVYISWLQENGIWYDWVGFTEENKSLLYPLQLKIGQPIKAKLVIIPHISCHLYFSLYDPESNGIYAFDVVEGTSHNEIIYVKEDGSITSSSSAYNDIIQPETYIEYIWELSPKNTWIEDYEKAQLKVSCNVDFASSDEGMNINLVLLYPNIINQKWQESVGNNGSKTPSFELIILIVAIGIILLINRKKKHIR